MGKALGERMKLKIKEISSLDIYRDGGSLSVSYMTNEKDPDRTLMFPIRISRAFNQDLEYETYSDPVIDIYKKTEYTSKVTGKSYPKIETEKINISWVESLDLLTKMEPFIENFKSDYHWVYGAMVKVAENNGKVKVT